MKAEERIERKERITVVRMVKILEGMRRQMLNLETKETKTKGR